METLPISGVRVLPGFCRGPLRLLSRWAWGPLQRQAYTIRLDFVVGHFAFPSRGVETPPSSGVHVLLGSCRGHLHWSQAQRSQVAAPTVLHQPTVRKFRRTRFAWILSWPFSLNPSATVTNRCANGTLVMEGPADGSHSQVSGGRPSRCSHSARTTTAGRVDDSRSEFHSGPSENSRSGMPPLSAPPRPAREHPARVGRFFRGASRKLAW